MWTVLVSRHGNQGFTCRRLAGLLLLVAWLFLPVRHAGATDLSHMSDEDLFNSAIAARDNGDCAWALELLRELLQRTDDPAIAPRALYMHALCLEETDHWEEAVESYRRITTRYPESDAAPDALFRQGMVLERQGRFRDAERCYRKILKHFQNAILKLVK